MQPDTLVSFTRYGIGDSEPELQLKLAGVWLTVCLENGHLPGAISFYADGVKLACEGSPVLEKLTTLESQGVHLILCKTCLDALGLADQVAVGLVGGMGDIVVAQSKASKVIAL